jgi:hypothetical protein
LRIIIKLNGESRSLITPLPKIIFASAMASSTKETHCLKENLDQNIEQERLIDHQLTLYKDKLKTLDLIIIHTNMQVINPLLCI